MTSTLSRQGLDTEKREQGWKTSEEKVSVRESRPVEENIERLPSGVLIRKISIDRSEELNRLLEKIAITKEKILEAQRLAEDHEKLRAEAEAAIVDSQQRMQRAELREREMEELKNRKLREEERYEQLRVEAHNEAVHAESERARAKAERVIAERTIAHTRELMERHDMGVKQALDLRRAYELALEQFERRRKKSLEEKDLEIEVVGAPLPLENKPVDIEVKVEAEPLPETRRAVSVKPKGGILRAHIEEQIPAARERPHITPERVAAERTQVSEERVEAPDIYVKRERISKEDVHTRTVPTSRERVLSSSLTHTPYP